jgi:hypothetical protein
LFSMAMVVCVEQGFQNDDLTCGHEPIHHSVLVAEKNK